MKLTALLLLIACVHVSGNGFSQKIVLSAKDMPLSNVFKSIEQQSGYTFFYDNRVIRDADHVTGDFQGNSPKQILDAVLKNQSLTYEIVDKIIVIRSKAKPPTPSTNSSQSLRPNVPKSSLPVSERKKEPMVELSEKMLLTLISEITVRGVVKDEKGEVLPGVSILIKGTQQGTVTGLDGRFNLQVPDQNSVLVFSFVGYLSKEVLVGTQTEISLSLDVDEKALEEVIVVGYGTQKKVNMTGAVGVIESRNIENRPIASALEALQGQAAGLNAHHLF